MDSAALASVAARYGVQLVLQHGSTVTGAAHPGSDRDLAVLFAGEPDVDNELRLLAELQALSPDREVDVVVLNHADPLLLKRVTERSTLLFGTVAHLRELKLRAFKRYQDHRRFLAMERDYVRRRTAAVR
jgi:predicted nucleotidyltransferase